MPFNIDECNVFQIGAEKKILYEINSVKLKRGECVQEMCVKIPPIKQIQTAKHRRGTQSEQKARLH